MKLHKDDVEHIGALFALEGERWRDEMRAGMASWDRGNRIDGARYRPLPLYSNQVTWSAPGRVVGWSVRAVGGPATVILHDSHDNSGDPVATFELSAAGATSQIWMGPGGVSFGESLFIEVTGAGGAGNGAVAGAIWLGAVD